MGQRHGAERQERRSQRSTSKTAVGAGGGVRFGTGHVLAHRLRLLGQGHRHHAPVQRRQWLRSGTGCGAVGGLGVGADGELRNSYGFIGQVTFTPANSKVTLAGSYGSSYLKATDGEPAFKTENSLISGGIYFQATKSLKVVGEGNYAWTKDKVAGTPEEQDLRSGLRPDAVLLSSTARSQCNGLPHRRPLFLVSISPRTFPPTSSTGAVMHHRVFFSAPFSCLPVAQRLAAPANGRDLGRP